MAQQLPKPGTEPVTGVAIEDIVKGIQAQAERGRRKYGSELMTWNGRDAGQDAWEEACDLVVYLKQMRMERADLLRRNAELEAQLAQVTGGRDAIQAASDLRLGMSRLPLAERLGVAVLTPEFARRCRLADVIAATEETLRVIQHEKDFVPLYAYCILGWTPEAGEVGFWCGYRWVLRG